MLKTGPAGLEIIKHFEGCKLAAYQDVADVWTIGYGDTGPDVKPGLVISQEEAERRLANRLAREFEPGVRAAIEDAPTTQGQFDSMVSLAYNIGVAAFKSSTVARMHKAGNYTAAAEAFLLWVKAGGKVLSGLVRRREEEARLYLSDVHKAPAAPIPNANNPDWHIREAQRLLGVKADGIFGPVSQAALKTWRATHA